MKLIQQLSENFDSYRQQAYDWFVENDVRVFLDLKLSNSKIRDILNRYTGGPLNLIDPEAHYHSPLSLMFRKTLKSPAPFKFGLVNRMSFNDTESFLMLDVSDLQSENDLILNDAKRDTDLFPLIQHADEAKELNGVIIDLRYNGDIKTKGLLKSAIFLLQKKAAYAVHITFRHGLLNVIISPQNLKSSIRVETYRLAADSNHDSSTRAKITETFNDVMDLQEWMFDNGYEDLL